MAEESGSGDDLWGLPTVRSQRRFLEVMSLASAVYYWFHIRINTESTVFGQSVHIGSTRYVIPALWIGLVWAALRYGQQLYAAKRDVWNSVRRDIERESSRLANRIVLRYLSRLSLRERRQFGNEDGKPRFKEGGAHVVRFDIADARRFDSDGKEVAPQIPKGPLGNRSHSVIETEFTWMRGDAGLVIDFNFGIGQLRAIWLRMSAVTAACVRRPALFDYIAPALMFLFGLSSLVLATIQGPVSPICAP